MKSLLSAVCVLVCWNFAWALLNSGDRSLTDDELRKACGGQTTQRWCRVVAGGGCTPGGADVSCGGHTCNTLAENADCAPGVGGKYYKSPETCETNYGNEMCQPTNDKVVCWEKWDCWCKFDMGTLKCQAKGMAPTGYGCVALSDIGCQAQRPPVGVDCPLQ